MNPYTHRNDYIGCQLNSVSLSSECMEDGVVRKNIKKLRVMVMPEKGGALAQVDS